MLFVTAMQVMAENIQEILAYSYIIGLSGKLPFRWMEREFLFVLLDLQG